MDVSWVAPTEPAGITIQGYYVESHLGATSSAACGTSPTALISTLTCLDTNVPSNTYTYTVTAVFYSWTATSAPSAPVTVPAPQLSSFSLAPSTTAPVAGTPFTTAITALDQYGAVDTSYSGPECLAFSGADPSPSGTNPEYPATPPCSTGSSVTFVDGVASGANSPQITLFDAVSTDLIATDEPTGIDGTTTLDVTEGLLAAFDIANPGTQTVGVPFDDAITATDQYGNIVTAYTGTQILDFSGPSESPNGDSQPTYPASVDFADGVGNVQQITLVDAETTSLTATQNAVSGTSTTFIVNPGPATAFSVANPGNQTVGVAFDDTITALDTYGNVATGFTGPQTINFSDPSNSPNGTKPTYPASENFAAGVGDAQQITLVDAQTTTLSASQSSISGTSTSFVVSPDPADYFAVAVPPAATVGVPFGVTITALDQYANVATGYNGTAGLVPTTGGISPTSITLQGGTVEFDVVLNTAGNQTITATDTTTPSITGQSGVIVVAGASTTTDTVTYEAGSSTSGTAPSDPNSPYTPGSTVTVLTNSGNLAESGYTFGGWNTQSNGLGVTYQPGDTFTISANTTLYPIFTLVSPVITTTSLASATQGQVNYSQTLQGTGGTTPYRWTITKGMLPQGLTLNKLTGAISGTVSSQAETETFTVTLTAASGASTSKVFTITVYACLQITTTSLASGTQGQANYSQTLQGTGGELPYTWAISQGELPSGLTLNPVTGVISGSIGAKATTETFTVTLSSANGSVTTRQFTISVSPCRVVVVPPPPPHIFPVTWCWHWSYRPVFCW